MPFFYILLQGYEGWAVMRGESDWLKRGSLYTL
jgi:hypothetical protein